ncbi:MAG: AAA family ATPase [Deltaproteobacteria bacterium]|nr:AAA family ATPase [Deltaproteobacteria bacterium]
MKSKRINANKQFIGREFELSKLAQIADTNEASIVVVYGRRRVGKTELVEQAFRNRNIIKFEGVEGEHKFSQMKHVLSQFSEYAGDPLIAKLNLRSWAEIFQLIAKYTLKGEWTLFLDELQWLASYRSQLIAELKYVWDNYFRQNRSLVLVLCGSSPSFIINKVLHSRALYNRSQHEIHLQEFDLHETKSFLGSRRSNREVMDAYLTVGGIPEYLKYLNRESSVFLGLCKNTFVSGSFFSNEYQRIFTSRLGSNRDYLKVIRFLSRERFAARQEIAKHIKCETGGTLTALLKDLELCGFITRYVPYNLDEQSLLTRYGISDQYLQFYFKFIEPVYGEIQNGSFNKNPALPINTDTYLKWLGYSFERLCRKRHRLIAKLLGFESVIYKAGAFFNRQSHTQDKGFQIDLVFDRSDRVITICEIKYLQSKATRRIIADFERKLELFPNPKKATINKVLITTEGADNELTSYFDRILTLDDIFLA